MFGAMTPRFYRGGGVRTGRPDQDQVRWRLGLASASSSIEKGWPGTSGGGIVLYGTVVLHAFVSPDSNPSAKRAA